MTQPEPEVTPAAEESQTGGESGAADQQPAAGGSDEGEPAQGEGAADSY